MRPVFSNATKHTWFTGALLALLLANLLAIVLISLKIPGVGDNQLIQQLFRQVLVYHVNLSMLYWMPLVACALWIHGFNIAQKIQQLALLIGCCGGILLILSSLSTTNDTVLSNYVPVRDSYLFLAAISCQLISVSLIASASLFGRWRQDNLFLRCLRLAAVCWLMAVASIGYSSLVLTIPIDGGFEQLFWPFGHIQQAANALLIAALWASLIKAKLSRRQGLLLWLIPASITFCLLAMLENQLNYRLLFTLQMSTISWLPMLLVIINLTRKGLSNGLLMLSISLAALGILVGLSITPGNLTIPAHYHGMTGAFNLAAIAYFMPANTQSWTRWLPYYYGAGLSLLIIGLTWAGNLGVARKLAGDAQQLSSINHQLAMIVVAIGAAIAITSSLIIIGYHFSILRRNPNIENNSALKTAS